MRGLVLADVGRIELHSDLPEPRIDVDTDAIVAVHLAGLCGSDLHPYEGREPARRGVVQGHELVGEVVEVGRAVRRHRPGDRVLAAFSTSCGVCPVCRSGLTARCPAGQLLGWGPPDAAAGPALHGGQAERVRVPLADGTLVAVPEELSDADAVLCTDNLPTAVEAVRRARPAPGGRVVVVGLGSVGLCAVVAARAAGAAQVLAVDPVADRRARARTLGAATALSPEDAAASADELAAGAVIEAAGTAAAQRLAVRLTAPGGICSVIAVQTTSELAFSPVDAYDRNLTVSFGRASVRATLDELLPEIADGRLTVPSTTCLTHPDVPLEHGPALYRRFAAREPGLLKAALRPGSSANP